jgi:hypothetical protein
MSQFKAFIEGLSVWAPGLPNWDDAKAALCGDGAAIRPAAQKCQTGLLEPAVRRRAPETAILACEVGRMAVQEAGLEARELPAIFTSAHGDLALIDSICSSLATDPLQLSPTRFLHSVHNAPAGYWSLASQSIRSMDAITMLDRSFAAGLFSGLVYVQAEQEPVLVVAYDVEACGELRWTTSSRGQLAIAMVLAPESSPLTRGELQWSVHPRSADVPGLPEFGAAFFLSANAMAQALPFLKALALAGEARIELALSEHQSLNLNYQPHVKAPS